MNTMDLIIKSQQYIEKNIERNITLDEVAYKFGYSKYHFARLFKSTTGLSVGSYIKQRRMIRASENILMGKKIIDVAFECGYNSHSSFSKAFKGKFGFSPEVLKAFGLQLELSGGNYMSHIFIKNLDENNTKEELYNILLNTLNENYKQSDIKNIRDYYNEACRVYSGIKRYSGKEYLTHTLNTAILLTELEAEIYIVIAGMFCDVLSKTKYSIDEIKIPNRVKDIITEIYNFNGDYSTLSDEAFMVKIAERLHNMRTVKYMNDAIAHKKSKETLEIINNFKNRIRNKNLLAELNDLALKYIN